MKEPMWRSALVSTDLEDEIILSWKTLKKLGIINGCFPCPPEDFQAVQAVEEAEKRWKTKKSVSFGYDDILAHAGLHEHHGVDDQQHNHGQASWDNVKPWHQNGQKG